MHGGKVETQKKDYHRSVCELIHHKSHIGLIQLSFILLWIVREDK